MANDIILTKADDLDVANGDFVLAESTIQDVGLIITSNKGQWKNSPLVGCDLVQLIRGSGKRTEIDRRVRVQLEHDNKDYSKIKDYININIS